MVLALLAALASTQAAAADEAGGAAAQAPEPTPAPALELVAAMKHEGHVRLRWEPTAGSDDAALLFELEEARAADFSDAFLRYAGPQRATFVSGLEDGEHRFRLRQRPEDPSAAWSAWSAPIVVQVEAHPMVLAWSLFGTGGVLVAAIVGFLVVAAARTREDEATGVR